MSTNQRGSGKVAHARGPGHGDPRAMALQALLLLGLVLACTRSHADDRLDMDRTKIIGNRELPKVLYIVPWKKPVPGELTGRPVRSVLDEALAPIDRDVFRRQVSYVAQIPATVAASAAAPAAGPAQAGNGATAPLASPPETR